MSANDGGDSGPSNVAQVDPGPIIVEFMGADTPFTWPNDGNISMSRIYANIASADYQINWFFSTNVGGAFNWLLGQLDTNGNGKYDPGQFSTGDQPRNIELFGHSWGGTSSAFLSHDIFTSSKFISKAVAVVDAIDPVSFGRLGDHSVWANVAEYYDNYQTNPHFGVGIGVSPIVFWPSDG